MTFVGAVERLGGQSEPRATYVLFVFDDVLIFAEVGVAFRPGFKTGKKQQDAVRALTELRVLTPDLVLGRWTNAESLAVEQIAECQLGKTSEFGLYGKLRGFLGLRVLENSGNVHTFLMDGSARESLKEFLASVLGDRFTTSV